jgi:hypothetical protein
VRLVRTPSRDGSAQAGPVPGESTLEPRELRDLEEQTQVGSLLLRALMRRELRLSLGIAGAAALLLGGQPLLARAWPAYSALHVLGVPLPWLILGVLIYPALILLGFFYVRRAEAIDEEFAELLRR